MERCEVRQVEGEGEGGATTVRFGQLGRVLVPWGSEVRGAGGRSLRGGRGRWGELQVCCLMIV